MIFNLLIIHTCFFSGYTDLLSTWDKRDMGYWKSKVLPKIKKVFEKDSTAKKAAAAEAIKNFDESKVLFLTWNFLGFLLFPQEYCNSLEASLQYVSIL